jgi:hypothetical protein
MNGRKRKRKTRKWIGNKEEKDTRKLIGNVRTPINETTRMYLLKNRTNKRKTRRGPRDPEEVCAENKEEKETRKLIGNVRTPINETTRMYLKNRTNKERPGKDIATRRSFARLPAPGVITVRVPHHLPAADDVVPNLRLQLTVNNPSKRHLAQPYEEQSRQQRLRGRAWDCRCRSFAFQRRREQAGARKARLLVLEIMIASVVGFYRILESFLWRVQLSILRWVPGLPLESPGDRGLLSGRDGRVEG